MLCSKLRGVLALDGLRQVNTQLVDLGLQSVIGLVRGVKTVLGAARFLSLALQNHILQVQISFQVVHFLLQIADIAQRQWRHGHFRDARGSIVENRLTGRERDAAGTLRLVRGRAATHRAFLRELSVVITIMLRGVLGVVRCPLRLSMRRLMLV